jgi:hypothetical protein
MHHGRWMVEVDGYGVVLDRMDTKRDDAAARSCHCAAVANIQCRVGKALFGPLLTRGGATRPKAASGASSRRTRSPSTRPSTPCTSPEGMRVRPCTYVQVPLADEAAMRVPCARDNVYGRHTVLPACTPLSRGASHVEGGGGSTTGSPAAFQLVKPPDR